MLIKALEVNMDNKKIIGSRINSALAMNNTLQKELAKQLNVKDNIVSYWCKGDRTPNTTQIIQIANCLNVSTDYLLGLTDVATNDKDLKFVCEYTGLDEKSVKYLNKVNAEIIRNWDLSEEEFAALGEDDEENYNLQEQKNYHNRYLIKHFKALNELVSFITYMLSPNESLEQFIHQLLYLEDYVSKYKTDKKTGSNKNSKQELFLNAELYIIEQEFNKKIYDIFNVDKLRNDIRNTDKPKKLTDDYIKKQSDEIHNFIDEVDNFLNNR